MTVLGQREIGMASSRDRSGSCDSFGLKFEQVWDQFRNILGSTWTLHYCKFGIQLVSNMYVDCWGQALLNIHKLVSMESARKKPVSIHSHPSDQRGLINLGH